MKTTYVLFGAVVCGIYYDQPFENVLKNIEERGDYDVLAYNPETMRIDELLTRAQGWDDSAIITEDEYNAITMHISQERGFYVIQVIGDIEPDLSLAFLNRKDRDTHAEYLRSLDPSEKNGIYWLDIVKGIPEIGTYCGSNET